MVLVGKKRVHKSAVVRNRCRTRLVAACKTALMQPSKEGEEKRLFVPGK